MNKFSYQFMPLVDGKTPVIRIDHNLKTKHCFNVALSDIQVLQRAGRQVTPIAADMMDLGGAILIADHFSPRREFQCEIELSLPIRNLDVFCSDSFLRTLRSILHFYTNDHWVFNFVIYPDTGRVSERQGRFFPRTEGESKVEVALFSGGLDSLGGLAHRLIDQPDTFFFLVSIGTHNSRNQNTQSKLADTLKTSQYEGRIDHLLINIPRNYQGELPINNDFRVRGFAFMLIGSAFALLETQSNLCLYENGIGAINLPFRASEVGLDHSLAVHPLALHRMSDLVSQIANQPFQIHNPFVFFTKSEVCDGLNRAGLTYLIRETMTCDRLGHSAQQCGTCSSCILRRQALQYLNLQDVEYAMNRGTYLWHMLHQVDYLQSVLQMGNPWESLARKYPSFVLDIDLAANSLGLSLAVIHDQILDMYRRYVDEWSIVRSTFDNELAFDIENIIDTTVVELG